jgi:predicted nucleic acid-binding protein
MIVIDANVAAWAVIPNIAVIQTLHRITSWCQQEQYLIAPDLWIAEAGSVIRRCVFSKLISKEEGEQAIDDLFKLGIETIPTTQHLCKTAFSWATKLQHIRLYDSLYLALAEQYDAELWSADKRLVNGAKQHGFARIYWIGKPA